jgi:putative multiple sugar transport system substrate-binding protein
VLIIAAIDGTALSAQLVAAAAEGIKVFAFDRLIRDSAYVDFYVTFENFDVGVLQATSLLVGLGILNEDGSEGDATGPFNVELFAGSLDDNNAFFFWDGAMEVLQPYIDAGTLVVKSGQTDIDQAAILRWAQEGAQARMENLLTSTYSDGSKVHGVLSPYDGLSRGIITALQNAGYSGTVEAGFPAVTGQDAEIGSVKLIADGVQFASIFKDTRKLAAQAIVVTQAYLDGTEPEANDTVTYDNGVKVVPSYLLESDIVYSGTITSLLVDSGYWTADEVAAGVAG